MEIARPYNKRVLQAALPKQQSKLQKAFAIPNFIQRYGINRLFRFVPFPFLKLFAFPFAFIRMKDVERKFRLTYFILFRKAGFSESALKKRLLKFKRYIIDLFLETAFFLPNHLSHSEKFVDWQNIEYLERALSFGKGAILCSIHFGEFLHIASGFTSKKLKIKGETRLAEVAIIANPDNILFFKQLDRMVPNIHIIKTAPLSVVEQEIKAHLDKNRVVLIFMDFAKSSQMRIPFYPSDSRYDLPIPVPQSASHFHIKYKVPIVPCISIPQRDISKSLIRFFPPMFFSQDVIIETHEQKKICYERISIWLNSILNRFILDNIEYWEEALPFFNRFIPKNNKKHSN